MRITPHGATILMNISCSYHCSLIQHMVSRNNRLLIVQCARRLAMPLLLPTSDSIRCGQRSFTKYDMLITGLAPVEPVRWALVCRVQSVHNSPNLINKFLQLSAMVDFR